LIVAIAVPIAFSLALAVNLLFGYTINRVTLFALILSLGLVVDDPITNVDNIQRHMRMRPSDPFAATIAAVVEILQPVVMSTLAIIASFLPLFFITGMMGPYMAPMAANVPLTVTFSTVAALTIVPWAAYHLLGRQPAQAATTTPGPRWPRQLFARLIGPLLDSRWLAALLLLLVAVLFAGSITLAATRRVPLKMLPFDNKDELQVVIDLPEGETLERTAAATADLASMLAEVTEVRSVTSYCGLAGPIDFNGLVRHYYLRNTPHLAELRIVLVGKQLRRDGSHELALRLRTALEQRAATWGATIQIVEVPPGPPVLATLVAEVYTSPDRSYEEQAHVARTVERLLASEAGVVSVDSTLAAPRRRLEFLVDKEKAALHGIDSEAIVLTLSTVLGGSMPARIHRPQERSPLAVSLRFPRALRSGQQELERTAVKTANGELIELVELGRFVEIAEEQPILHKDLERVVYVYGETAGRAPGEAVLDLQARLAHQPLPPGYRIAWAGEGEWEVTLRVFRDLGLAFGFALLGIYLLLILETRSFVLPLVIMLSIPLTAIGILPGFWLLNLWVDRPVGGYANPVFFTATGMIGMIALGGIVVRNAIVLIDFIRSARTAGSTMREAIIDSVVIRARPILLTAGTTALGAWPITLDPIFSGLAWSLIFGLTASTAFTVLVVPVVYHWLYRDA
jgi:multidrug efflux pump subunit AcrB